MKINKPMGYDEATTMSEPKRLPAGGYVVKIMDARCGEWDSGTKFIAVRFDIAEGNYQGFYGKQYNLAKVENNEAKWKGKINLVLPKNDGSENDQFTIRRLKTNITSIEHSNNGFVWDWDTESLKGKTAGMLFRNREYEFNGNHGFWTEPLTFYNVDRIRKGDFETPKDKLLDDPTKGNPLFGSQSQEKAPEPPTGFEAISDDDIPF